MLDELRALAKAYPDDAAVRAGLAGGLCSTLYFAKLEGDPDRRDALLDELRALGTAYPDDAAVRYGLALSLHNTVYYAKAEGDLGRHEAALGELRGVGQGPSRSAQEVQKVVDV